MDKRKRQNLEAMNTKHAWLLSGGLNVSCGSFRNVKGFYFFLDQKTIQNCVFHNPSENWLL